MLKNFPANPTPGQQVEGPGYTYQWNADKQAWQVCHSELGSIIVDYKEPTAPSYEQLWWDRTEDTLKCWLKTSLNPTGEWVDNALGKKYDDLVERLDHLEVPVKVDFLYVRQAYGNMRPKQGEMKLAQIEYDPTGHGEHPDLMHWRDYNLMTASFIDAHEENPLTLNTSHIVPGDEIKISSTTNDNWAIYDVFEVVQGLSAQIFIRFKECNAAYLNELPPQVGETVMVSTTMHPPLMSHAYAEGMYLHRDGMYADGSLWAGI